MRRIDRVDEKGKRMKVQTGAFQSGLQRIFLGEGLVAFI